MDSALRRCLRDGDPLRAGQLLRRAGRVGEGLDLLEAEWRGGHPGAGELLLEVIAERPGSERLDHGARLERLAGEGLTGASLLLQQLVPEAQAIVGGSPAMRSLRAFICEQARTSQPVVLWGEDGVGHTISARTVHALSGREGFHQAYGPRVHRLLRREIEEHPADGGTLYLSHARSDQGWEDLVLEVCRRRQLRLIVGAVGSHSFPPPLLHSEDPAVFVIPPLRERFEDLPALLTELLCRVGADVAVGRLRSDDLRRLEWHDWPANVRELANHVKRAVIGAEGDEEVVSLVFQGLFGLPGETAESA